MFFIGICDDEQEQREHIKRMCEHYFMEIEQNFECICFSSGEEVISYCGEKMHLLFLDIELGNVNGIEVLKKIEESGFVWRVVFISNHTEAVFHTFGLRTLDFGKKPVTYEKIKKWILIAMRENQKNIVIQCQTVCGKKWVNIEEIFYIKSAANYSYIKTRNEKFLVSCNLKYWEKQVPAKIVTRAHKSYLVNVGMIKKIEKDSIYLSDEENIPIGRLYKNSLVKTYQEYIKDKVRGRI